MQRFCWLDVGDEFDLNLGELRAICGERKFVPLSQQTLERRGVHTRSVMRKIDHEHFRLICGADQRPDR